MREPQVVGCSTVTMLSLSASGIPASGPGTVIRSPRPASASSNSGDQCSVAFRDSARANRPAVSRAIATAPLPVCPTAPLTCPPWHRVGAPERNRPDTPEPGRQEAAPMAPRLQCRPGATLLKAPAGRFRPLAQSRPGPAARRNPRFGSSGPPAGRALLPLQRAPPVSPHAEPDPGRYSCALPFAFQAGIRHQQLFDPNLLVIKGNRHLEVPAGAHQSLNGATAEPPVAYPLAFD